jgi:hypothetical protein
MLTFLKLKTLSETASSTICRTNVKSNGVRCAYGTFPLIKTSVKYCNGSDQRVARQQLCKHGPTRNNGGTCVFYAVTSRNNGGSCVFYVVTSSTIQTVFHGFRSASV